MSSIEWHTSISALTAGGAVQTAVTVDAVEETLKEFSDITGGRPVTEDEFRAARDGYLRALPAQMETHGQLLSQLVGMAVFGLPNDYLSSISDGVRVVSLDDLHRVAAERVDARRLKLLVVGDGEVIEPGLRKLGLPIIPVDYDGRPLQ
jgi:zinc protease